VTQGGEAWPMRGLQIGLDGGGWLTWRGYGRSAHCLLWPCTCPRWLTAL